MKFAVIKTGGKQYLVREGDKLKIEKLPAPSNDQVIFDQILLFVDGQNVKIGTPLVDGAEVTAKVLKQGRSKKIIVFHYHSKTRYKKKAGHRQHFSEVEITGIK